MEKYNKILIIASIVVLTLCGIFLMTYVNDSPGLMMFSILMSIFMTCFCIIDAKEKEFRLPWSTYWLIFMFWPLAVPVYLFSSRKGKKKWMACVYIVSYLFLCFVGVFISLVTLPWAAYYAHDCGEYKIAIRIYSTIINQDDKDAWAYYNRGNAYYAIGLTTQGENDYMMAKYLDPALFKNEAISTKENSE